MDNKGNNNNGGNGNNGGNNKNGMTIMVFILAALLVLFLTSLLNSCARDATNKEITYSEFVKMVEEDKVAEVMFTSSRIKITPKGQDMLMMGDSVVVITTNKGLNDISDILRD